MNSVQKMPVFFKDESIQKTSMISLKPGQILLGRVEKLFPNHTALIQFGNVKLYAHLNASLSAKDSYWFEVQSNGGDDIVLKVLEGNGQNLSHPSIPSLLKQFQLPETKFNLQLLQFFLSKNLPIRNEHFSKAVNWISQKADVTKEFMALELMIKKDLPFTNQTFQSLVAVQESTPFYRQLEQLRTYLEDPKFASLKTVQQLKQMISTILDKGSITQLDNGAEVKQMLKQLVQMVGLEYEKAVESNANLSSEELLHSLKPLLLKSLTELGASGRELEPILNRLTGMQLISQDINGPVQQISLQLPIAFGEKQSDVTIQWSGRRRSDGQIDPDYCRILFYLELQHINQTVIDMQIQNRIIHATVINDSKEMEPIVTILKPQLEEKLECLGYKLSFIKVIPFFGNSRMDHREMNSAIFSGEVYQGVDIKI